MDLIKTELNNVVQVKNGFAFKSNEYTNSGLRVIRITNVQKGEIVDSNPQFIDESRINEFNEYLLLSGDILISLTGNVGRVGILTKDLEPAVLNQRVACIRVKNRKEVNSKCLFQYLNSDLFERECIRNSNGIAQLNLSSKWLENYKIPLPETIDDQIRIATVLTRAEKLIAKRKASIAALDELLKSTFLEMFGDPVRNEKGWDEKIIIDACNNKNDIKCGPFGTQLSKSEFQKKGVPLWGIPQINSQFKLNPVDFLTTEKAAELSDYSIEEDDIVMSRKGTVGKCSLYPANLPKGVMHSDVLRIRTAKHILNPIFLCYQLRISRKVEKQIDGLSKGAIMAGINVGKLKSIYIVFPPIPIQTQFAAIVEKVESIKAKYTRSLTELENLYASLSQRAFKGELDLSGVMVEV